METEGGHWVPRKQRTDRAQAGDADAATAVGSGQEECRHRLTKGSQLLHGLFMEAGVDLED